MRSLRPFLLLSRAAFLWYRISDMRAIAFGVLLVVFVAGYHGQQKHSQSSDIQKTSQHPPTKTVAPVAQLASTEQKQSAYEKTKSYFGKAFGPEFFAAWVLVVAAGIGLYVTWRTARAALLNAEAVINAERPWLVVTWSSKPDWPGSFLFGCKNRGNTPAKVVSMSAKYLFVDKPENLPVPPDYSSVVTMPDLPFKVGGDEFDIGNGINATSIIKNAGKQELVETSREFLVYYGNVVYKDTFFPDSSPDGFHETRWCFVYYAAGNKGLKRNGPEEYNRYT